MPLDLKALGVTVGVDVGIAAAALALLTVLRAVRPTRRFYAPRRWVVGWVDWLVGWFVGGWSQSRLVREG